MNFQANSNYFKPVPNYELSQKRNITETGTPSASAMPSETPQVPTNGRAASTYPATAPKTETPSANSPSDPPKVEETPSKTTSPDANTGKPNTGYRS